MFQVYQKPLQGKRVGIVFGSFAPLHQGHLDLIMRAKKENDGGCIVVVCGFTGDKGEIVDLPMKRRYRYVREMFSDDNLVAVCGINDTELEIEKYPNGWEKWLTEFNKIYNSFVLNPEITQKVWYVGDPEYQTGLAIRGEKAILLDRDENLICATSIRNNPIKNWSKICGPFKRVFSTNILIAGTASEGKTTSTQDLGKYFNAPYSYEWARGYMKESCVSDNELDSADYLAFLEGQYSLNRKLINSSSNNGIFFADTDSMVTKMYAKYYSQEKDFNLTEKEYVEISRAADEYTRKSKWDKIFLLPPKNNFVDDNERYMAHGGLKERNELFKILCEIIIKAGYWDKVEIIKGNYYENFETIKYYVKEIINYGKN